MCMIIPFKSVVANAFIELRREKGEENVLLFDRVEAYRRKIIDLLIENEEIVAIPCSGNDVSDFFEEYSYLFELEHKDKKSYIHLKGNKESVDKELMDFNACLPLKFLAVVSNSESAAPLFQARNAKPKTIK